MIRESVETGTAKVRIVPGVSMLAVLSHLNYQPWFALAEYVDNAVQSMIDHRQSLHSDGQDYLLRVDIDMSPDDGGTITIRDNAAGIARSEFPRAFRPAEVPPDKSGLSEFGMGMKSASCWFAPRWSVRTTSKGDPRVYAVNFDVKAIVRDEIEELDISEQPASDESHFTEVRLANLYHLPVGRSVGKIKQHLTDIYRALVREGELDLRFNGEKLVYIDPEILSAPHFRDPASGSVRWWKEISFDFGKGLEVHGFAAIRATGSTSNAGFSLFRRNRVIQGSGDEGYRPQAIFGAGNTYRSQRIFGELHLSGFDVSHTKDGFQWEDNEDVFLNLLREELDADPMPLLRQAEGFRKTETSRARAHATEAALVNTSNAVLQHLPEVIPAIARSSDVSPGEVADEKGVGFERNVTFDLEGKTWSLDIEIRDEPANQSWYTRSFNTDDPRTINVKMRLNSAHPFLVRFGQRDSESIEIILRMAVAGAVGEFLARQADSKYPSVVTRNINRVLSEALSGP